MTSIKSFCKVYGYQLVLAGLILLLIIFKIPYLKLPYYWDEAWSYIPAIFKLYNSKIGILPGALPADFSKGHPLLFYFTAAWWMKLFGTSIITMRLLPMLLSILLIIVMFVFCKNHFSENTGLTAIVLLMSQSIFLVQSSFLLPEILLALLTLLTIHAYLKKNKILLILWATLLLLTKESGLILLLTLFIHQSLFANNFKTFIKETLILCVPLFLIVVYFIKQKLVFGWYVFPEHLGYVNLNVKELWRNFGLLSENLFILMGRIMISLSIVAAILIAIIKKIKHQEHTKKIVLFLLFILLYMIFTSVNFFSMRYLICIFPVFMILGAYFIQNYFRNTYLKISMISISCVFLLGNTFSSKKNGDCYLEYADVVKVHQKVVAYCEEQNWYNSAIATHFLMKINLTNPEAGYLKDKKNVFKNVRDFHADYTILIISSVELTEESNTLRIKYKDKLMKRFELNNSWSEIYSL